MISEVSGNIRWVLLATQISFAFRKSLVTFRISSRFIVISSCSCVYELSKILPSKCHVTFGGGDPPITSHNKDISLPSLNGCGILARLLLAPAYIIGFFGGTASANWISIIIFRFCDIALYAWSPCLFIITRSITFIINLYSGKIIQ